jgi:hypothetical protein
VELHEIHVGTDRRKLLIPARRDHSGYQTENAETNDRHGEPPETVDDGNGALPQKSAPAGALSPQIASLREPETIA